MRMFRRGGSFLVIALLAAAVLPGGARVEPEAAPGAPYGVNAHIPTAADCYAAGVCGFRWVRVDFTWNILEAKKGKFRWEIVERVLSDAEANGLRVLPVLGYCPSWASSGPDPFYPPAKTFYWERFVKKIVRRYHGRITHWILWNEPNVESFFHGTREEFVQKVLLPGARIAKEADPSCKIVGPDLAHLDGASWDAWLEGILTEAGPSIDVIGHHCYREDPDELFRQLEGPKYFWESPCLRDVVEQAGQGDKPLWLTEFGWRSTALGEDRQAGYLYSVLDGATRRPWITKLFIYELRDTPQLPGYGLLRLDGTAKKSFPTVQGFIRSRPAG